MKKDFKYKVFEKKIMPIGVIQKEEN